MTKQLNVRIPASLDKELERHCYENDMKKKDVVEMALVQFFWEQPATNDEN